MRSRSSGSRAAVTPAGRARKLALRAQTASPDFPVRRAGDAAVAKSANSAPLTCLLRRVDEAPSLKLPFGMGGDYFSYRPFPDVDGNPKRTLAREPRI
jgi:hypothetical protein